MNLMDLCKDLLVYLVQFREKAPTPAAPTLQQARADVLAILDRMEVHTRREPSLALPFQKARYALVALADEVFTSSGWDRGREWQELTLERQIFQTSRADYHFFELIDQADPNDQEMTAIYYICLALGFTGRFDPDHPELAEYKRRLIARLPEEARPKLPGEPLGRKKPRPEPKPLSKPARKMLVGGLALFAVAALVGAGWLLSPDNFLPGEEKSSPPAEEAAAPAKVEASAQKADSSRAKAEPKQATPETETKHSGDGQKPDKQQLVLVPGRTVTASKPVPPPEPKKTAAKPERAAQKSPPAAKPAPQKANPAVEKKKPAVKKKKPVSQAKSPARGAYQILVASFVGPKQAYRLADKLKSLGYPAKVELLPRPGKKPWYVVKVIPLKNKPEARRVASAIKRKLKLTVMVRPAR